MNTIVCRSPQEIEDDMLTEAHTAVVRDIREVFNARCFSGMELQHRTSTLKKLRNMQARIERVMLGEATYRDTFGNVGVWYELAYAHRP